MWGRLAALVAASVLCACEGLESAFTADPVLTIHKSSPQARLTQAGNFATFDLHADCMPVHLVGNKCPVPSYKLIYNMPPDQQAAWRNRFQDHLIWRSEQVCEKHRGAIIATQATTNFGLNFLTTIVTTASTIITGNLAKSILAGTGAASNATRSHFSEDIYQRYVAPAVIKRILELRESELKRITNKRGQSFIDRVKQDTQGASEPSGSSTDQAAANSRKGDAAVKAAAPPVVAGAPATAAPASPPPPTAPDPKPTKPPAAKAPTVAKGTTPGVPRTVSMDEYSLDEAIVDVERYHQQCSFAAGLSDIVDPKQRFHDTRAGIRDRIKDLRDEITENQKIIDAKGTSTEVQNALKAANRDLARQIEILSLRLSTALDTLAAPAGPGK